MHARDAEVSDCPGGHVYVVCFGFALGQRNTPKEMHTQQHT